MSLKMIFGGLSLGASVDQQTGSLSVYEIVDELRAPQVPFHVSSLVISMIFEKTVTDAAHSVIFIHLQTPDGKTQLLGNGDMTLPADRSRSKAVFRFGSFPVMSFGAHRMVVSWTAADKKTKVGESLFDFEAIQITQVAQGVGPGPNSQPGNKGSLPN
jgi:hypothetical protein